MKELRDLAAFNRQYRAGNISKGDFIDSIDRFISAVEKQEYFSPPHKQEGSIIVDTLTYRRRLTIVRVISANHINGYWFIDFIDQDGERVFWQEQIDGGTLLPAMHKVSP